MNFDLDPDIDALAEQSLASLRRPIGLPLPDEQFIDKTPLNLEGDRHIWETFYNSPAFPLAQNIPQLTGKTIVFDLDETLLMNSYISPEIWALGAGYPDKNIQPAFKYSQLKKTPKGHLQKLLGRTDYDTTSAQQYPFLKQPRHIVIFRPGILHGLRWLKQQGTTLVLATASARQRVQYLATKFPLLTEIFEDKVITANEIAYYYHKYPETSAVDQMIFHKRLHSLAAKVPTIFNFFLKINDYDLLVDDSKTTKQLFTDTSLAAKLLAIDSDKAVGDYGLNILIMTVNHLLQKNTALAHNKISIQKDLITRLEDPYYWCLCHTKDQISLNSGLAT